MRYPSRIRLDQLQLAAPVLLRAVKRARISSIKIFRVATWSVGIRTLYMSMGPPCALSRLRTTRALADVVALTGTGMIVDGLRQANQRTSVPNGVKKVWTRHVVICCVDVKHSANAFYDCASSLADGAVVSTDFA